MHLGKFGSRGPDNVNTEGEGCISVRHVCQTTQCRNEEKALCLCDTCVKVHSVATKKRRYVCETRISDCTVSRPRKGAISVRHVFQTAQCRDQEKALCL